MNHKNKWQVVKRKGITFFFKYDEAAPDLLHIYARHLITPGQALAIWFNGDNTVRNDKYKRFETTTNTHCLLWTWLNEKEKKVMIISCFERADKDGRA